MTNAPEEQPDEGPGLGREIRDDLVEEARSWVRWAGWGALIGAVVLGAAGGWWFGATVALYAAGAGAVLGGIGAWWLYLDGSTVL